MVKIYELEAREERWMDALLEVWEKSVRATHLFLSEEEIGKIKEYVPMALEQVAHLIVAEENGIPAGFMGVEKERLEMLFLAPEERGRGLGKRLLLHGIETYGIMEVTVNEQNPQVVGFYRHLGFETYRRTELDEEGNPYPLLYMKREEKEQ